MVRAVPERPKFSLDVRRGDGAATVVVAGELDLVTVPGFRDTVIEQLRTGSVRIDLAEVEFMDSSGVAALDALHRQAAEAGHDLVIAATIQRPVARLLDVTGMMSVLRIEADHEEPA